jgi:hypothetical protein
MSGLRDRLSVAEQRAGHSPYATMEVNAAGSRFSNDGLSDLGVNSSILTNRTRRSAAK